MILDDEVKWPANANSVADSFHRIAGMPCIAGAIDGTLIPIDAPSVNEQAYVDRYGDHSINVMVVAGADLKFNALSCNFPGSVHDSRVLQRSRFYRKWNEEEWRPFPGAIIIGDSGYPVRKWLFTPNVPIAIPASRAKSQYLMKLRKTRQVVECAIGCLKEIFPCLNRLRLKTPKRCATVINACVVLYNIRKRINQENELITFEDVAVNDDDNNEDNIDIINDNIDVQTGIEALRNYLSYFN